MAKLAKKLSACYDVRQPAAYYPYEDCLTLVQARRELAKQAREGLKRCRQRHARCTLERPSPDAVKIAIGGRMSHTLYTTYYIGRWR